MGKTEEANHPDRSIEDIEDDLLERGPFVDSLIRALVSDQLDADDQLIGRRSTGYVVGLTGLWGLGKSTVLNFAAQKMKKMDHVTVAVFNPWIFGSRDELLNGFFDTLRSALGKSPNEEMRDLATQLEKYWQAIGYIGKSVAAAADAAGGLGSVSYAWGLVEKLPPKVNARSPIEEKHSLEEKLNDISNEAVVVLIDELDRVEDDEVREVVRLVKAVGDIRGISYLVAYDPTRITDALGRGTKSKRVQYGERYIEKVIQHAIPLRPLFEEDLDPLFEASFAVGNFEMPSFVFSRQEIIWSEIRRSINSPRDVKRLVGAFLVIYQAVRGEVCPYDTLGYCWLHVKSPSIREKMAANFDKLVDDPAEAEMNLRMVDDANSHVVDLSSILGPIAEDHIDLLHQMFPRFRGGQKEYQPDAISRRRNLVRLLYLGNPPTMIARKEIEQVWNTSEFSALESDLISLVETDKIRMFLDRLDDLLLDLPVTGDTIFWPAISKLVTRKSDWLVAPEQAGAIAEDSKNSIINLSRRDKNNYDRAKSVVNSLVKMNDLALLPKILRSHLFHYGLAGKTPRADDGNVKLIYDLAETKMLLSTEAKRYRKAIKSGFALKRLPSPDIIFALSNVDLWDDTLRKSLTRQLQSSNEAISTFAALIVPPGYVIDKTALDKIVDTSQLLLELDRLGDPKDWIKNEWVQSSVVRLTRILMGDDPMFIDMND